jgi:AcrR family transcriptional regulator
MNAFDEAGTPAERRSGRPRSTESHQAILKATIDLLAEEGYQAMSIEGIATRAQVGKATIYRRWSSKEALVIDAIAHLRIEMPIPIVDTGHLRSDLILLIRTTLTYLNETPILSLLLRFIGEVQNNPAFLQSFFQSVVLTRLHEFAHLVEQAQARDEIRSDVEPLMVMSLIFGALMYRLLITTMSKTPPPSDLPEQIVDLALQGLAHPIP